MGEVFRARGTRLDRTVAIKVLPAEFASDAQLKTRFEREARAISQISHPNICALHDVGNADGVEYLVLEFLEGETLAERIACGPLPIADVLRLGSQIAAALACARRAGIVHRDLKPGNVIVTRTGAKLLDFGLWRSSTAMPASSPAAATQHKPLTQEGTIQSRTSIAAAILGGSPRPIPNLRPTPDDRSLAVATDERFEEGDVWLVQLAGGTKSRLSFTSGGALTGAFSPDGTRFAMSSGFYGQAISVDVRSVVSNDAQKILDTRGACIVTDWSHDGRYLVVDTQDAKTGFDVQKIDIGAKTMTPVVRRGPGARRGRASGTHARLRGSGVAAGAASRHPSRVTRFFIAGDGTASLRPQRPANAARHSRDDPRTPSNATLVVCHPRQPAGVRR